MPFSSAAGVSNTTGAGAYANAPVATAATMATERTHAALPHPDLPVLTFNVILRNLFPRPDFLLKSDCIVAFLLYRRNVKI